MNIRKKEYEEIKKRLEKAEKKAAQLDELVALLVDRMLPEIETIAQRVAEETLDNATIST